MTSQELLIDKRIVQRNIEQGKLEPAEYQRLLNALPDLSDKVWRRPSGAEAAASHSSSSTSSTSMPAVSVPATPAMPSPPEPEPIETAAAPQTLPTQTSALPG
jgi:hypothetical protein